MKDSRSLAARLPHAPMNSEPASGVAVPCPLRSGWWHVAQLAWYAVAPAVACAAVNGPAAPAGCWPAAGDIATKIDPANATRASAKRFLQINIGPLLKKGRESFSTVLSENDSRPLFLLPDEPAPQVA